MSIYTIYMLDDENSAQSYVTDFFDAEQAADYATSLEDSGISVIVCEEPLS
jgi:basic membrane lipoprotein Med (substrate-binding protein (PBP1-ABC) superfamily)